MSYNPRGHKELDTAERLRTTWEIIPLEEKVLAGPVARLHCSLCFRGKEQWGTGQAGQRYLGFSTQVTPQTAVEQLSDAMVSPSMCSPPASSP